MQSGEIRKRFLEFFKKRGHTIIPSASLVPENDPTTLFTGSGMQPMLPYLLGEKHPLGIRIVDSQKCFRTVDIEEVGDNRHTTFFEMLGNWSLGDYWKEEQLSWLFEFLTTELGIKKDRLWVSCFEGDKRFALPEDSESVEIWKRIGVPKEHICFYDTKKNWWSRSGVPENMPVGEPGGPDSEIFYDFGAELGLHEKSEWKDEKCHPNCDCGRFMEIGNSVFMEYRKTEHGFEKLKQRNVDFGGGLERITAAVNNEPDVFKINIFSTIIKRLEEYTSKKYADSLNQKSYRIIADHIRAAVFLMADGVMPSNTDQGYFVRKLLRRAILHLDKLSMNGNQLHNPINTLVTEYKVPYENLLRNKKEIEDTLNREEQQFRKTLERGLKVLNNKLEAQIIKKGEPYKLQHIHLVHGPNNIKMWDSVPPPELITGEWLFDFYQTFGFPMELTVEELRIRGYYFFDRDFQRLNTEFRKELKKHQQLSRAGAEQKFKGGLADHSEQVVKYHTATHLLHQALRDVLGKSVGQKGSNITAERLRFDFTHPQKMTPEEIKKVEEIVDEKIKADLPVQKIVLPLAEAEKTAALHFFGEKYPEQVNVYFIGDSLATAYSKEFCGGPHVARIGALGHFKILKEEAVSQGVRRIKAVLV